MSAEIINLTSRRRPPAPVMATDVAVGHRAIADLVLLLRQFAAQDPDRALAVVSTLHRVVWDLVDDSTKGA